MAKHLGERKCRLNFGAYLPLYAAGTPWLRTFAWNAATLGLALMIVQIGNSRDDRFADAMNR